MRDLGTLSSLDCLSVDLRTSMKAVAGVDPRATRVDMRTVMGVDMSVGKSIVVLSRWLLRMCICMRTMLLSGSLIADQSSRITLNSGTRNRRLK